jgi:hypothetical protein
MDSSLIAIHLPMRALLSSESLLIFIDASASNYFILAKVKSIQEASCGAEMALK